MAFAGKRRRHRRDDKPEKFPLPQRDASILEPVQKTPQANAQRPDAGMDVPGSVAKVTMMNQDTKIGELASVAHGVNSKTNPNVSPEHPRVTHEPSFAREKLRGGTEPLR